MTGALGSAGTGGKALRGLKVGLEAREGSSGFDGGEAKDSSGEAKGGLGLEGLLLGDCLGGREGGASSRSVRVLVTGDTDLTVLTLAFELKLSLEEVRLILLRALLTCTTLSKDNLFGRLGAWGELPNSYFLAGAEDLGGGGGGGRSAAA